MRRLLLAVFLLFACWISIADARVDKSCVCAYKSTSGVVRTYTLTVSFMKGQELNFATATYRYLPTTVYAMIWFGEGQCATVSLPTVFLAGTKVTDSNFRSIEFAAKINDVSRPHLSGFDEDGTFWIIMLPRGHY